LRGTLISFSLKNSNPKSGFRLDVRLVGIVFLVVIPAALLLYLLKSPLAGIVVGLLALAAVWIGARLLVVRKISEVTVALKRLAAGDLTARTGLAERCDEIGELARSFDQMASTLSRRIEEREIQQHGSLNRALQQAAVAALGQFALTSSDFGALLNQAANLISQTLEVEFCRILELLPDGRSLLFRAGVGWRKGVVGISVVDADPRLQAGFTLQSGEPVVIPDLRRETRFSNDPLLGEHRAVSGVSVAIAARGEAYGVLAVYSRMRREFNSDDVQFLLSVSNILAVAVEHIRAEAELKKLADFARLNPNPAMELKPDGSISYFNEAAQHLTQAIGHEHPKDILPGDIDKEVRASLTSGRSRLHMESRLQNHVLSWSLHPMAANQVVHCYVTDITDRLNLEAQLRQSQKMESVGQLAAGVAHDFNNMLTVIQGHAGMLMTRPTLSPELRDSVQSVSFAAERAASLTRQLLMFSRKSVMQPKLIDLREVVGNMTKMLKRLLGETITLEFEPPVGLPLIEADPAMMEQVMMNLSVNARDAMAMGGKLSIRMEPIVLEDVYIGTHPEAYAGNFVRLRVIDTGHGMKPATIARIFEPFFTTKEVGKGTGLGLATVYGIVKQHKGWVEVASEYGKGTVFTIFLPAASETTMIRRKQDMVMPQVVGGTETILLVEDEATVLEMGKIILQDCGYRVLEASSGVAAVELWREHRDTIALLLTDMVMPQGVSGTDLAEMFLEDKPTLKVLFTSGYSVDQFDTEFLRNGAVNFLQKPYTRFTLAKAVRERLDQ
jgi:signal transduction histidine kinase/ActR/RegA family two-component response regulator/HAMP domain-containing protein